MRYSGTVSLVLGLVFFALTCDTEGGKAAMETIKLPESGLKGPVSVEEAICRRRSRRRYTDAPLTIEELGQLLWCAQGVTGERGRKRAAPSAGATYPMTILVAVGPQTVGDLDAGVYTYLPAEHALVKAFEGDVREEIAAAALGQDFLAAAPADILMAADYSRTAARYGERAVRYTHMEAGHISQNIYLQAEALGLATVAVGAFRDEALGRVFRLPENLDALYLMPAARPHK